MGHQGWLPHHHQCVCPVPTCVQKLCRFIVEVCSGAPVALSVVCNLLRYGHCDASEFVRLYSDPRLPMMDRNLSNTNTGINLPFESRAMNERLQRCAAAGLCLLQLQLSSRPKGCTPCVLFDLYSTRCWPDSQLN
jgi:hypothetical protein